MEQQRNKQPIRMKRNIRKPKKKKPAKLVRRKCDSCSKKFWPEEMVVKHGPLKYVYGTGVDTEGMPVVEFERLYSDKRKRPFQDRRCNVLIVCRPCYDQLCERWKKR